MERPVEFYSEGVRVRGYLTAPQEARGLPGIVLCHGFGALMAMDFPDYARRLADQGYAVLRFDYRHFGESEGEPRNLLLPLREVEDVRNAITFFQQQPEVDPARIGLWGTSFGGAIVIYTAAVDERVKAVVANVPVTNGRRWIRSVNTAFNWERILDELEADRVRRVLTGESKVVPVSEFRPPDPHPSVAAYFERFQHLLGPRREMPWRSVEAVLEFAADEVADRISPRALLIIAAPRDTITPLEQAELAYARAREPKRLVLLPRHVAHFEVYTEPIVSMVMEESLAWFRQYL